MGSAGAPPYSILMAWNVNVIIREIIAKWVFLLRCYFCDTIYILCGHATIVCAQYIFSPSFIECTEWMAVSFCERNWGTPTLCTLPLYRFCSGHATSTFCIRPKGQRAVSEVPMSWLDFIHSFTQIVWHSKEETNKQKPKWNPYHVPGIVLKGKDTAKKEKCLTL